MAQRIRTALVCPNPFKGTLTAGQAAAALARGLRASGWRAKELPLADGGPGTLEAVAHAKGGRWRRLGRMRWLQLGPLAVLESAEAVGLARLRRLDPLGCSTEGLGRLLLAAKRAGCREAWVGLGGTASTDGGSGMARALGWRFLDAGGREVKPGGGGLPSLAQVLPPSKHPLKGLRVSGLCDVSNPLLGPQGAARVFAPQKGATPPQVRLLDQGLRRLASLHRPHLALRPGAGAAGGLGYGLMAFCGGKLLPGAASLLELSGFHAALKAAGLVVTGEGRLDGQTLRGKLPGVVLAAARRAGKPCVAVCGRVDLPAAALRRAGFAAVLEAPGRTRIEAGKALAKAAALLG